MAIEATGFEQTADKVGTGIEQFFSGKFAEALPLDTIFTWGKNLFILALILVGGAIIYKMVYQYKIRILIRKKKGSGIVDNYWDWAKITTDEKMKTKMVLLKTKKGKNYVTTPVPPMKFTHKIGKKDFYMFDLDDKGELTPVEIAISESVRNAETPIETEVWDSWSLDEKEVAHERYKKKGFLMEHLNEIIVIIIIVAAFMFGSFTIKTYGNMAAEIGGALREVARNCLGN